MKTTLKIDLKNYPPIFQCLTETNYELHLFRTNANTDLHFLNRFHCFCGMAMIRISNATNFNAFVALVMLSVIQMPQISLFLWH